MRVEGAACFDARYWPDGSEMSRAMPATAAQRTRDTDLVKQLRRAGASVALNISDANRRVGKDRPHLFRIALGSAAEVAACLEVAVALGYLDQAAVTPALELVDRVRAMTYRLANR